MNKLNWNNLWALVFLLPAISCVVWCFVKEYLWARKQKKQRQSKELGL